MGGESPASKIATIPIRSLSVGHLAMWGLPRPPPAPFPSLVPSSSPPACYPLFCAPVVSCFVYTCVYSCVPTCTLLYTRVYTEAIITTSSGGSPQPDSWALFVSVGGLLPASPPHPYYLMYPRARVAGICVAIWNYGEKCTTFADANPSEGVQSRRDERGGR